MNEGRRGEGGGGRGQVKKKLQWCVGKGSGSTVKCVKTLDTITILYNFPFSLQYIDLTREALVNILVL